MVSWPKRGAVRLRRTRELRMPFAFRRMRGRRCSRVSSEAGVAGCWRVETGGLLFGERDDAARVIWITDASDPPPDSRASRHGFICGVQGTAEMNAEKRFRSRGSIQCVGTWHGTRIPIRLRSRAPSIFQAWRRSSRRWIRRSPGRCSSSSVTRPRTLFPPSIYSTAAISLWYGDQDPGCAAGAVHGPG